MFWHCHVMPAPSACCKHPLVMWSLLNVCNTCLYLQWFHWYLPVFDSKYSGILCMADVKARLCLPVLTSSVWWVSLFLPQKTSHFSEVLDYVKRFYISVITQKLSQTCKLFNLKSCGVYHETYTNSGIWCFVGCRAVNVLSTNEHLCCGLPWQLHLPKPILCILWTSFTFFNWFWCDINLFTCLHCRILGVKMKDG